MSLAMLAAQPRTAITVNPLASTIGAELLGPDLSRPLDDATLAEIRQALWRWKVMFFRDQTPTPEPVLRNPQRERTRAFLASHAEFTF